MAYETVKFQNRTRTQNPEFWGKVLNGTGLDVGCGPCPLEWANAQVTPFDTPQGDGNLIGNYFQPDSFDFVFSSQFLEHTHDPVDVLRQMIKLVKKGGWVIGLVPCVDHYERCIMPSVRNADHKSTWSLWRKTAPTKFRHIFVPELVNLLAPHRVDASLETSNFDYFKQDIDQTWKLEDGVEAFVEIRIQKAL